MAVTRAASAASSLRAKQELVRLLFGRKAAAATTHVRRGGRQVEAIAGKGMTMDHSNGYTHAELKSAYLQRVQELHPDKHRMSNGAPSRIGSGSAENGNGQRNSTFSSNSTSEEFILLQEAWRRYEDHAKVLSTVENGSREADFTMFGVGCSFSDSDAERDMRNEITDQACRGWFSAGQIGEGDDADAGNATTRIDATMRKQTSQTPTPSLLDEDMFVSVEAEEASLSSQPAKAKSLIDHMMTPKR